tara:strand:+ start:211 stop:492 length:282 start_codon:yes stop_codon:yes gene_type:complete
MPSLNEGTELNVPLKNLISLIAFTCVAVWGYSGLTGRIGDLEKQQGSNTSQIEENEGWINGFQPPEAVKDTVRRVRDLEIKVERNTVLLEGLK